MTFPDDAVCLEYGGTDYMFPDEAKPQAVAKAKKVCDGCTVRAECLQDALADPLSIGIRGGLATYERRGQRKPPSGGGCGLEASDKRYHQHYRNGEKACADCLAAHNARSRELEAAKKARRQEMAS